MADEPLQPLTKDPVMTPAKRFVMDALRAHCDAIHGQPLGPTFHVIVDGVEVKVTETGWIVCETGAGNG
jgi:hypothetical protein